MCSVPQHSVACMMINHVILSGEQDPNKAGIDPYKRSVDYNQSLLDENHHHDGPFIDHLTIMINVYQLYSA